MKTKNRLKKGIALGMSMVLLMGAVTGCGSDKGKDKEESDTVTITNVSYDPTRELYEQYNKIFKDYYKEKTGKMIEITQSHGGSGSQARSVVEGNEADVVTLALAHDITLIEEAGMIEKGWLSEFEGNSSPYTSTITFLVRKGNEKGIKDWDDLVKDGVEIITPDPKSSGGACWNFLAAWYYADKKFGGDEAKIKEFMAKLYKNVLVMDSGARGATTTFVENGEGDVLIAWENEALLSVKEHPDDYEMVTPSISIKAEPSVAIVDENADKNGTQEAAKEYLNYLYSDDAQKLAGQNFYRPSNQKILETFSDTFDLSVDMCTIDDFGGWDQAYKDYFQDDAIFDEIYNQ
ncbi:sulfate ABC transporter substrate-binding protein [bacterium 1xD8-6]|nr:sulfate ABC transporter substrate-binding protein [bacterium D16-36]RKI72833.1 sulfate ABC transporter substrate-binding protein [bacterium 1xD8-6]